MGSVIEAAEERDPRFAPPLMLAALTGMRRGELCALRWTDVHLDLRELGVSRSVVVVPGGLAEKGTKTHRSRRVALDDVGVALLRHHRANVTGSKTAAGAVAPVEDRLVFTVEEAAQLLGISRSFAYEAVQRGDIPSMFIGRRILVPKAALQRFLEASQSANTDQGQ